MQKKRLSFKTLILVIGLIASVTLVLVPQRAKADYEVCHDSFVFNDTNYSLVDHGYWATSLILGETDDGLGAGYYANVQADFPSTFVVDHIYFDYYPSSGSRYYNVQLSGGGTYTSGNVFNTGTPLTWQTITLSFSAINATHVFIQIADSGVQQIKNVRFCATYPGTPSPTPTATGTPAYIPPGSTAIAGAGAAPGLTCNTPSTINSQFLSGSAWTLANDADYSVPLPQRWLDLPPSGSASLPISLAGAEYTLKVIYQASFGSSGGGSIVATVAGLPITIQEPSDSAEHTFESEPTHFQAGSALLILSKPSTDTDNVTIKFVCLSVVPTDVSIGQRAILTGGDNNDACATCDPPFSITDIPGILNWIVCNLRRLFTCYFLPMLTNVLAFIGLIIVYILGFIYWITRAAGSIVNWVGDLIGSVWTSLTGWFVNLFVGIKNDFQSSGIAQMVNTIMAGARDLPTAINNGISIFGAQLSDIFLRPASNLLEFILRLIIFAAGVIAYVLGLIPLIIQSFIDGINSSGTPVSGSPLCSDPSAITYYPCLGFYVLDNTIFAGPAGLLLPVLVGVVVFYNIIWIFTSIKEELSK